MKKPLSDSQVATILCALRDFQGREEDHRRGQGGCGHGDSCDHFEEAAPLTAEEIDDLCESINFDTVFLEYGDGTPLSPHSLGQRELAEIVEAIQTRLYLDATDDGVQFWNQDCQWECVEDLSFIGAVMLQHGLIPFSKPKREASDIGKPQP